MELYLLRHGIAEDHAATDADRQLTDEGRQKLHRVMKRAAAAGVEPSLILSSPYKRALETAEIAASELHYKGEILRTGSLTPDSSPPSLWSEIRDHRNEPAILLAGHEPLFSSTVAFLLDRLLPSVAPVLLPGVFHFFADINCNSPGFGKFPSFVFTYIPGSILA